MWSSLPSTAKERAEDRVETAKAEAEVSEDLVKVDTSEDVLGRVSGINSRMTELIVLGSLLVIGEYGEGFRDFLEFVFRVGRFVSVWVVLKGKLPVLSLYLILTRSLRDV